MAHLNVTHGNVRTALEVDGNAITVGGNGAHE